MSSPGDDDDDGLFDNNNDDGSVYGDDDNNNNGTGEDEVLQALVQLNEQANKELEVHLPPLGVFGPAPGVAPLLNIDLNAIRAKMDNLLTRWCSNSSTGASIVTPLQRIFANFETAIGATSIAETRAQYALEVEEGRIQPCELNFYEYYVYRGDAMENFRRIAQCLQDEKETIRRLTDQLAAAAAAPLASTAHLQDIEELASKLHRISMSLNVVERAVEAMTTAHLNAHARHMMLHIPAFHSALYETEEHERAKRQRQINEMLNDIGNTNYAFRHVESHTWCITPAHRRAIAGGYPFQQQQQQADDQQQQQGRSKKRKWAKSDAEDVDPAALRCYFINKFRACGFILSLEQAENHPPTKRTAVQGQLYYHLYYPRTAHHYAPFKIASRANANMQMHMTLDNFVMHDVYFKALATSQMATFLNDLHTSLHTYMPCKEDVRTLFSFQDGTLDIELMAFTPLGEQPSHEFYQNGVIHGSSARFFESTHVRGAYDSAIAFASAVHAMAHERLSASQAEFHTSNNNQSHARLHPKFKDAADAMVAVAAVPGELVHFLKHRFLQCWCHFVLQGLNVTDVFFFFHTGFLTNNDMEVAALQNGGTTVPAVQVIQDKLEKWAANEQNQALLDGVVAHDDHEEAREQIYSHMVSNYVFSSYLYHHSDAHHRLERIIVLFGVANSGKSRLIELFNELYPPEHIGVVSPSKEEKFGAANYIGSGRWVSIAPEVTPSSDINESTVRTATTDKNITFPIKHGAQRRVDNICTKIIMACNNLPDWDNNGASPTSEGAIARRSCYFHIGSAFGKRIKMSAADVKKFTLSTIDYLLCRMSALNHVLFRVWTDDLYHTHSVYHARSIERARTDSAEAQFINQHLESGPSTRMHFVSNSDLNALFHTFIAASRKSSSLETLIDRLCAYDGVEKLSAAPCSFRYFGLFITNCDKEIRHKVDDSEYSSLAYRAVQHGDSFPGVKGVRIRENVWNDKAAAHSINGGRHGPRQNIYAYQGPGWDPLAANRLE